MVVQPPAALVPSGTLGSPGIPKKPRVRLKVLLLVSVVAV